MRRYKHTKYTVLEGETADMVRLKIDAFTQRAQAVLDAMDTVTLETAQEYCKYSNDNDATWHELARSALSDTDHSIAMTFVLAKTLSATWYIGQGEERDTFVKKRNTALKRAVTQLRQKAFATSGVLMAHTEYRWRREQSDIFPHLKRSSDASKK